MQSEPAITTTAFDGCTGTSCHLAPWLVASGPDPEMAPPATGQLVSQPGSQPTNQPTS